MGLKPGGLGDVSVFFLPHSNPDAVLVRAWADSDTELGVKQAQVMQIDDEVLSGCSP